MKKSKISTIKDAWLKGHDVSDEVYQHRLSKCDACPYNSKNAEQKDMTVVQRLRKGAGAADFCVICDCPIAKKIGQSMEECAKTLRDMPPEWNRVRVEMTGGDELNLEPVDPSAARVDYESGGYIIDFGDISAKELSYSFHMTANKGKRYTVNYFRPSCGACTKATHKRAAEDSHLFSFDLNLQGMGKGRVHKKIYLGYTICGSRKDIVIHLKGNKL